MDYWKDFYETYNETTPSDFCSFVLTYFKNKKLTILDCGCGNGRDTYHFGNEHTVTGIDLATCPENKNCVFKQDNFCTMDKKEFNVIYSRFTFHSITNEDQELFLKGIYPESYLCIETRSDKGQDSFRYHGDTHYRNLTNYDYLIQILKKHGFDILYQIESNNLAVYKNENPICIRVLCKKNS